MRSLFSIIGGVKISHTKKGFLALSVSAAMVLGFAFSSYAQEETSAETGKTLVVYYSATGNTEEAAKYIAETVDGDLFELEPGTGRRV